jgi:hypothetical protein
MRTGVGEACFRQRRLHSLKRPKLEKIRSVRQGDVDTASGSNRLIDQSETGADRIPHTERCPTTRTQHAQHFAQCRSWLRQVHEAVAAKEGIKARDSNGIACASPC